MEAILNRLGGTLDSVLDNLIGRAARNKTRQNAVARGNFPQPDEHILRIRLGQRLNPSKLWIGTWRDIDRVVPQNRNANNEAQLTCFPKPS